jgi:hypothetical protein
MQEDSLRSQLLEDNLKSEEIKEIMLEISIQSSRNAEIALFAQLESSYRNPRKIIIIPDCIPDVAERKIDQSILTGLYV